MARFLIRPFFPNSNARICRRRLIPQTLRGKDKRPARGDRGTSSPRFIEKFEPPTRRHTGGSFTKFRLGRAKRSPKRFGKFFHFPSFRARHSARRIENCARRKRGGADRENCAGRGKRIARRSIRRKVKAGGGPRAESAAQETFAFRRAQLAIGTGKKNCALNSA